MRAVLGNPGHRSPPGAVSLRVHSTLVDVWP